MIQDISPLKLDNQYKIKIPKANDTILNVYEGKILLKEKEFHKNKIVLPKVKDIKDAKLIYAFSIDKTNYFLSIKKIKLDNYVYMPNRDIRNDNLTPKHQIYAIMTGKHLTDWYNDTNYCGRCGHKLIHSKKERAMCCKKCGNTIYPRIMPAVIVGVINKDKILLTKYRTGFGSNALIAGFTEIGETLEETVAREVKEEAGVNVKNIRYYKSQPWGVANDILAGFYCDVDGDTTITMDNNELKYAQWVSRKDIELQPNNFSLTNEMMYMFKNNLIT